MSDPLYNDDLEAFLQKQVNKHRMYASGHVWQSIQDSLHERRRWPALTFILLFIISLLVIGTLLVKPEEHLRFIQRTPYLVAAPAPVAAKADSNIIPLAERIATGQTTERTIAYARQKLVQTGIIITSVAASDTPLASINTDINMSTAGNLLARYPQQGLYSMVPGSEEEDSVLFHTAISTTGSRPDLRLQTPALAGNDLPLPGLMEQPLPAQETASAIAQEVSAIQAMAAEAEKQAAENKNKKQKNNDPSEEGSAEAAVPPIIYSDKLPSRWEFHLYVTPSASYRGLVEERTSKGGARYVGTPMAPNYLVDVNSVVRHTPARGIEIGFGFGYHLNDQFTLRAGLQYNMRQYNIEASGYSYELTRIALNGRDTITTYTPYRNIEGNYPVVLHNRYHELSMPLGINWTGWRRGKWAWGVSTTVQPTYTFNKQPFIISSDFKNYTNGAMLTRRWNLNTSFEMFLGYRTGNVQWQLGPQFRYQQFSSFKKQYPIKEYLLDYGIKLGMTTPL